MADQKHKIVTENLTQTEQPTVALPTDEHSYPVYGDLGDSAPSVSRDDYMVVLQVLPSPKGPPLLLETAEQVRARYAFYLMNQKAKLVGMPENQALEEQVITARRDAEIEAFTKLAQQFASKIKTYTFQFRVPSVYDVEAAEAVTLAPRKAQIGSSSPYSGPPGPTATAQHIADPALSYDVEKDIPVRARNRFRRWLAARTLVKTDYPNFYAPSVGYDEPVFAAIGMLPNSVMEYVLSEVAQRISFNTDALSFFESWGLNT